MGVGQLSESDAVDALRLPFYSSSHPTGSHGWRNQFDLGNPECFGVVLLPVHHPLHVAAKTATLDIMSDDRVDVGVGRAGNPYQLEPFGVKLEDTRGIWAHIRLPLIPPTKSYQSEQRSAITVFAGEERRCPS